MEAGLRCKEHFGLRHRIQTRQAKSDMEVKTNGKKGKEKVVIIQEM